MTRAAPKKPSAMGRAILEIAADLKAGGLLDDAAHVRIVERLEGEAKAQKTGEPAGRGRI